MANKIMFFVKVKCLDVKLRWHVISRSQLWIQSFLHTHRWWPGFQLLLTVSLMWLCSTPTNVPKPFVLLKHVELKSRIWRPRFNEMMWKKWNHDRNAIGIKHHINTQNSKKMMSALSETIHMLWTCVSFSLNSAIIFGFEVSKHIPKIHKQRLNLKKVS